MQARKPERIGHCEEVRSAEEEVWEGCGGGGDASGVCGCVVCTMCGRVGPHTHTFHMCMCVCVCVLPGRGPTQDILLHVNSHPEAHCVPIAWLAMNGWAAGNEWLGCWPGYTFTSCCTSCCTSYQVYTCVSHALPVTCVARIAWSICVQALGRRAFCSLLLGQCEGVQV